jgi:hypothetical protein
VNDNDVRWAFDRLLVDEPPLHLDPGPVMANGARLRRRRRFGQTGIALLVTASCAAAVTVPLTLAQGNDGGRDRVGAPQPAQQPEPWWGLRPEQERMARAIVAASPAGLEFEMGSDRWEQWEPNELPALDGLVDDGDGPSRLLVGLSPSPGSQQLHPCQDAEFRQEAACSERTLADGAVLSLRGLSDHNGVRTVTVALTHPDGGGVFAESGNFALPSTASLRAHPTRKPGPVQPTRAMPVYTVEQLADVVLAVDGATR